MTKEFSLEEGSSIVLDSDSAYNKKLSKSEIKKRFSVFDEFMN
jgi:hypothetical protein